MRAITVLVLALVALMCSELILAEAKSDYARSKLKRFLTDKSYRTKVREQIQADNEETERIHAHGRNNGALLEIASLPGRNFYSHHIKVHKGKVQNLLKTTGHRFVETNSGVEKLVAHQRGSSSSHQGKWSMVVRSHVQLCLSADFDLASAGAPGVRVGASFIGQFAVWEENNRIQVETQITLSINLGILTIINIFIDGTFTLQSSFAKNDTIAMIANQPLAIGVLAIVMSIKEMVCDKDSKRSFCNSDMFTPGGSKYKNYNAIIVATSKRKEDIEKLSLQILNEKAKAAKKPACTAEGFWAFGRTFMKLELYRFFEVAWRDVAENPWLEQLFKEVKGLNSMFAQLGVDAMTNESLTNPVRKRNKIWKTVGTVTAQEFRDTIGCIVYRSFRMSVLPEYPSNAQNTPPVVSELTDCKINMGMSAVTDARKAWRVPECKVWAESAKIQNDPNASAEQAARAMMCLYMSLAGPLEGDNAGKIGKVWGSRDGTAANFMDSLDKMFPSLHGAEINSASPPTIWKYLTDFSDNRYVQFKDNLTYGDSDFNQPQKDSSAVWSDASVGVTGTFKDSVPKEKKASSATMADGKVVNTVADGNAVLEAFSKDEALIHHIDNVLATSDFHSYLEKAFFPETERETVEDMKKNWQKGTSSFQMEKASFGGKIGISVGFYQVSAFFSGKIFGAAFIDPGTRSLCNNYELITVIPAAMAWEWYPGKGWARQGWNMIIELNFNALVGVNLALSYSGKTRRPKFLPNLVDVDFWVKWPLASFADGSSIQMPGVSTSTGNALLDGWASFGFAGSHVINLIAKFKELWCKFRTGSDSPGYMSLLFDLFLGITGGEGNNFLHPVLGLVKDSVFGGEEYSEETVELPKDATKVAPATRKAADWKLDEAKASEKSKAAIATAEKALSPEQKKKLEDEAKAQWAALPGLALGKAAGTTAPGETAGTTAPGETAGTTAPGKTAGTVAPGKTAGTVAPGKTAGKVGKGKMMMFIELAAAGGPAVVGKTPAVVGKTPAVVGKTPAVAGKTPAVTGKTPAGGNIAKKKRVTPFKSAPTVPTSAKDIKMFSAEEIAEAAKDPKQKDSMDSVQKISVSVGMSIRASSKEFDVIEDAQLEKDRAAGEAAADDETLELAAKTAKSTKDKVKDLLKKGATAVKKLVKGVASTVFGTGLETAIRKGLTALYKFALGSGGCQTPVCYTTTNYIQVHLQWGDKPDPKKQPVGDGSDDEDLNSQAALANDKKAEAEQANQCSPAKPGMAVGLKAPLTGDLKTVQPGRPFTFTLSWIQEDKFVANIPKVTDIVGMYEKATHLAVLVE